MFLNDTKIFILDFHWLFPFWAIVSHWSGHTRRRLAGTLILLVDYFHWLTVDQWASTCFLLVGVPPIKKLGVFLLATKLRRGGKITLYERSDRVPRLFPF
jgi:hypothetical protein